MANLGIDYEALRWNVTSNPYNVFLQLELVHDETVIAAYTLSMTTEEAKDIAEYILAEIKSQTPG